MKAEAFRPPRSVSDAVGSSKMSTFASAAVARAICHELLPGGAPRSGRLKGPS